ncbi:MAG: MgtC/SapB family protein [Roseiarcus sp.]|jgi:uncharacterized membrane protein YhiD involved in acid resistance|uniref:MgtC/SapB family protein n=1 Tax=Roseiarcus sp. TaxID=1969460 RepID=UPI003C1B2FB0
MRFIETFDLSAFVNSAVCLLAAFVLGTLIGAERQYRQRSAGLRTNASVEALEGAHYPVAEVETSGRGDDLVDIVATLAATSVVAEKLDAVAAKLERARGVEHATWEGIATG